MRTVTLATLSLVLLCAAEVRAQERVVPEEQVLTVETEGGPLPLPWSQRPLTLTEMTLRIDAGFLVQILPDGYDVRGMVPIEVDPLVMLYGGGAFGIIDDFEVGAILLPLHFSPRVRYANPSVYAIFRFLEGTAELGATVRVTFPAVRNTEAWIDPGVLLLLHLGESARLDVGVYTRIAVIEDDSHADLRIPVSFAFNVMPALYFGAGSGFILPHFDFDLWQIPIDLYGGYTIANASGGPLLDLEAHFGWEALFTPGQDGDQVHGDLWYLHFLGRAYIDL